MTRTARQKRISRQRVTSRACRGKNCPTPSKHAYLNREQARAFDSPEEALEHLLDHGAHQ